MNLRICAGLYSTLFLIVAQPQRKDRSCLLSNVDRTRLSAAQHLSKIGVTISASCPLCGDGPMNGEHFNMLQIKGY
ncbi:hypothetical protein TNCV_5051901 [Trichonephila clavipes]|nr:hypothetical protein TNCV_5051901 [Trichonephila clavipes]